MRTGTTDLAVSLRFAFTVQNRLEAVRSRQESNDPIVATVGLVFLVAWRGRVFTRLKFSTKRWIESC